MVSNTIFVWAIVPVVFGFWARTAYARVLTPRFITWYYRYLVVHPVVIMVAALAVWPSFFIQLACSVAWAINLYFVWYEYFNAHKPNALPFGIKVEAVAEVARESLLDRIWPNRRGVSVSSVGTPVDMPVAQPRGASTDVARVRDIDLGIVNTPTPSLQARGRLWVWELLFSAQEKTLEAKRKLNEEAVLTLRSREKLQEAIERDQHLRATPVIVERVRDEFKAEEDERTIRQRERDERLVEQDRKAKEAEARRVAAEVEIELQRRRREGKPTGETKPSETADEAFRRQIQQVLKHGSTGRFMLIAEECRAELIAKRGGEEHLTDDDRERIELAFEIARRRQESKG